MSGLADNYLKYPKRGYGQDHGLYKWRLASKRPKLNWRGDAKVGICFIIPLEFFPLNPSGTPFKHPGAMVTPYPDLRHFTVRDYGNRVGVYRILEAFAKTDVKGSFAVNGEIARRYPPLLDYVRRAGHEVAGHGLSTNHIHHEEMSASQENQWIIETQNCFDAPPSGWMSPARNQSSRTVERLAANGVKYCLDWEMDQVPVMAETSAGDISLIPNNYELSDFTLLHTRRQTEESWKTQILNAVDVLSSEHARFGGQVLGLTLTPYIIGQPFRIWALEALLMALNKRADVSVFTAIDIDQQFREQI